MKGMIEYSKPEIIKCYEPGRLSDVCFIVNAFRYYRNEDAFSTFRISFALLPNDMLIPQKPMPCAHGNK